ncbi:UDP-4-amino-4,6-dideoxy-N-acetyl-beta-L-altrosamine transaminase [Rossellomorea aquimaris]|uniref:UDP-4-amino-4, 6-dideoxy-N-acetyl-beta-L-altrosamine transaminase n=1 Tax=Rossellomorea aquimaris TaxID=189382 RepID=UPI001CD75DF2|nr:UDP-4-amino-4,6-dideoxy-N-acetyl-beta-L-altrosamine transaminase [Rossellomorea aquimaris]MCA1055310.1 UDP-4-amino-4,6-dideoxy-N-acetyl-beta-L-altrosamine transaminase [Rossellomorea aquimaris]
MLAIHGGKPARENYLSYGKQWVDDNDIDSVIGILKSPYITQGPAIEEFEEKFARYVGVKYAVAFSNGTAALHGACHAAGVGEGDEVITSPITFAASANCSLYVGAKPVFADIHNDTYNINPEKIEEVISSKTKAIIPVDFTGQPAEMSSIKDIANKHNLVVIEDAAHSLGATYSGSKIGSLADMTMFSFHPVKHITTGEGGIIVTDSIEYAEKLRLFRSHGIIKNNFKEPWYYEMVDLGYNYRMTDVQAALGLSQIEKLEKFIELRREIAQCYNEAFAHLPGVIIPNQLDCTESSWHLYILRLDTHKLKVNRLEIFNALRAENIGVHVHYIPVYWHPYYEKLGYKKGLCPIAESWYEEIITLPIFPKMSQKDTDSVIEAVNKVIEFYQK